VPVVITCVKRNDGAYIVKSLTTLEDFNEYFNASFNEDADTIGGVVMTAFGHVPQRGEKIGINRFEFEVLRADSRRIHLLKVEPVLESA
jgi:magnesium and cobalt transporter